MNVKVGGGGVVNQQPKLGQVKSNQVTSLSGGFGKLDLNKLGPSPLNHDAIRRGQVGLPPPEGETDPGAAAEGAQLMRALVTPSEDGKYNIDLTAGGLASFANSASEPFADLDGYQIQNNLGSIGEEVSPERREQLRRLSQRFEERLGLLGDEQRQAQFGELADRMGAKMNDIFAANNIQTVPSEMERFFKFDKDVPQEENFLARLGGFISAMRGEEPNGASGPRLVLALQKAVELHGAANAPRGPAEAAFAKSPFGNNAGGKVPGGGGVPPAGGSFF